MLVENQIKYHDKLLHEFHGIRRILFGFTWSHYLIIQFAILRGISGEHVHDKTSCKASHALKQK